MLELVNPASLAAPDSYTQVVIARGTRLVFIAGQVAEDAEGRLVGSGDLAAQAQQAFRNVAEALAAGGARPEHVAKITLFVVGLGDQRLGAILAAIEAGRVSVFGDHKPADALVGVEALAHPGCLVEIEAMAVVDDA